MNIRPICTFINGPCLHLAPFPSPDGLDVRIGEVSR